MLAKSVLLLGTLGCSVKAATIEARTPPTVKLDSAVVTGTVSNNSIDQVSGGAQILLSGLIVI